MSPTFKLRVPAIVFAALMAPLSLTAATQVYRCSIGGSVTYQRDPCPSGESKPPPTVEQLNAERQKRLRQPNDGPADASEPTFGGQRLPSPGAASASPAPGEKGRPSSTATPTEPPAASFKCDVRRYCSQMTSCAEAKYFLAHCPGVKMDGDGNGIPCERQWCSR